jgi:hypothetical protein
MIRRSRIGLVLAGAIALSACGSDTVVNPSPPPPPVPVATPTPAPTPVPVANVTGSWDSEARRWHFRIQHDGSTVTGQLLGFRDVYYSNPEHGDLAISGTVSSTGAINFGCAAFGVNFEGRIESSTRMTGTLYDCGNGCRNYGDVMVKTAN